MDQNTIIQAAFSLFNNKGAYALLLGSGISRSASIPTGWEITQDMIRQLASMSGESSEPDPEKWYFNKYGKLAGYSELLDRLGKTPAERSGYLKSFFEPNDQDREDGKKSPTVAHRSIARLVAEGYVRVIITTNFDRLLEQALQEVGVTATVIASPDSVDGATPIVHSKCTIVKVNGDYLDTRTKNTESELRDLDPRLNLLLDRIFDEFGLLVCGWSGEWDQGLRTAIERTKGRRYSCYWCGIGEPAESALSLIKIRSALPVKIHGADQFFSELESKVFAVAELNQPHPLSAKIAVVNLKKYIAEDKYRIRLHDLLMGEVDRVCSELDEKNIPMHGGPSPNGQSLQARIDLYLSKMTILTSLFAYACYWGRGEHDSLLVKSIERISNCVPDGSGYTALRSLRFLPASIMLYAGGMAAIRSERYDLLEKLVYGFKVKGMNDSSPAFDKLQLFGVMEQDVGRLLPGREREFTPIHNVIFEHLKETLKDLLPSNEFEDSFHRFENFASLIYAHYASSSDDEERTWAPAGRFGWQGRNYDGHISKTIERELEEQKSKWLPLTQGLFAGREQRAKLAIKRLNWVLSQLRYR